MSADHDSKTECPACGAAHDMARTVDHVDAPRPNDLSLCSKCGALSTYGDTMVLKIVPDAELMTPAMATVREYQARIRRMRGLPVREEP